LEDHIWEMLLPLLELNFDLLGLILYVGDADKIFT